MTGNPYTDPVMLLTVTSMVGESGGELGRELADPVSRGRVQMTTAALVDENYSGNGYNGIAHLDVR